MAGVSLAMEDGRHAATRILNAPLWSGQPLSRTIDSACTPEQGRGDEMHFIRMAACSVMPREVGPCHVARPIPQMIPLFTSARGIRSVDSRSAP